MKTKWKLSALAFALALTQHSSAILINEIKVNPPGTDNPYEYVELIGDAGENISHVYLVVLDGTPAAAGTCRLVVNVGKAFTGGLLPTTPPHPLIMINGVQGHTTPAGTTHITVGGFDTAEQLRDNGALTVLLVRSNTVVQGPGFIAVGTDYDANNDGVIDIDPLRTATVLDAIGWRDDETSGDRLYPNGGKDTFFNIRLENATTGKPDAATRFPGDFRRMTNAAWYGGCLTPGNPVNPASIAYVATAADRTANFPTGLGAQLTPGSANVPAPVITPIAQGWDVESGDIFEANPGIPFTVNNAGGLVTWASGDQTAIPDGNISINPNSGLNRVLYVTPKTVCYNVPITLSFGGRSRTILYSASASGGPNTKLHRFMSDASAAVPISPGYMFVGDDELPAQVSFYPTTSSGEYLNFYEPQWQLGLFNDPTHLEVDIEGATRATGGGLDRIYWIGSHGNEGNGQGNDPYGLRPNRSRLFAMNITGTDVNTKLGFVGYYSNLRADLIARDGQNWGCAKNYRLDLSAASGIDPKEIYGRGFNIEAIAMAGGSTTTAYLGFRAPLVPLPGGDPMQFPPPANTRDKALVVPINNIGNLVTGNPTAPVDPQTLFGCPIELDLRGPYGGRGIRSMEYFGTAPDGTYLIIAGRPGPAQGKPGEFALFNWDGVNAPTEWCVDFGGMNPEGLVDQLTTGFGMGARLRVISDSGTTHFYGAANPPAKDLPWRLRKFRSDIIKVGVKKTGTYSFVALPDVDAQSKVVAALGIDGNGFVAGFGYDASGAMIPEFPMVWSGGTPLKLPTNADDTCNCPGCGPNYWTARINAIAASIPVGYIGFDASDVPTSTYWHSDWQSSSTMTAAGCQGSGYYSEAKAINASGMVVGYRILGGNYGLPSTAWRGLYANGWQTQLDGYPNSTYTKANAVNSYNVAAGVSRRTDNNQLRACLWLDGLGTLLPMIDLGTLSGGADSEALGVNDNGTVVGYAYLNGAKHACLWQKFDQAYQITDLGILQGGNYSVATAINNCGQVVGYSAINAQGNVAHAVTWINGTIIDLNSVTTGLGNYTLARAYGLNDLGRIVGSTSWNEVVAGETYPPNNTAKAFLLAPQ